MKFKIRHEQKWIIPMLRICILLFFVFGISIAVGFPVWLVWLLFADIAAIIPLMLLYFLEQAVGTSLLVEADAVTIKYIFHKRKIAVADISNLDIESYKRWLKRYGGAFYPDYRMRMTITLYDGRQIILSDKATKSEFAFATPERLPEDEIPLYMAYTIIKSFM